MNLVVLPRIVSKTLCMLKYFKSILNFTKMFEKACFANIQPSVFVEQYPVSRFSLKIFYGHNKTKKKHGLLFSQSVSAACILNNIPICAGLLLPCSDMGREGKQMQSAVSLSCNVQLFVCLRIYIDAILITFLRWVSADDTQSWNSSRICLEI